jgi:hypothetical protein
MRISPINHLGVEMQIRGSGSSFKRHRDLFEMRREQDNRLTKRIDTAYLAFNESMTDRERYCESLC